MNIPGNRRVLITDLPLIDVGVGESVWVEGIGKYEAVPRDQAEPNAIDGPADALTPISWQPAGGSGSGSLSASLNGGVAETISEIAAHGGSTIVDEVLDLTPDAGTPYDAEIAGGSGATTLVTCPIPSARRLTIGVDWNVYNEEETLAGYQLVVVNRVSSDAPTILVSSFDSATVQTAPAWSPRLEISGNSMLVRITADVLSPIRAKVRAEILQSIDISDAPEIVSTVDDIIARIGALNGFWWRAEDAVDVGGGLAGSIPDAVANANTITFQTAGAHEYPTIGTLSGESDVAIVLDGTQQALPASSVGAQTSHTFICLREHVVSAQIQSLSWGSGVSGTPGIVVGHTATTPGVFVTSEWITDGVASESGAFECLEYWLDDTANEARIFRNGVQTGATGAYVSSVVADLSLFGCTDTVEVGAMLGRITDIFYIPSAIGASDRAALFALFETLHPSLGT